jgi:hypothetical protein
VSAAGELRWDGERQHLTALGAAVTYVDGDHVYWCVTEHDGRAVPGSRGERCLVFASETATRRVWDYPFDWRQLPPAALATVSWRR